MKTLAVLFLTATSLFGGFFLVAGLDVTGHVFPFIGVGFSHNDGGLVGIVGITRGFTDGRWILEGSIGCFQKFGNFKLNIDAVVVHTLGFEKTLYLVGPGVGYSFGSFDVGLMAMFSLPLGATERIKGPVPIVRALWNSDTLF